MTEADVNLSCPAKNLAYPDASLRSARDSSSVDTVNTGLQDRHAELILVPLMSHAEKKIASGILINPRLYSSCSSH
jgi:hypothetical protein